MKEALWLDGLHEMFIAGHKYFESYSVLISLSSPEIDYEEEKARRDGGDRVRERPHHLDARMGTEK